MTLKKFNFNVISKEDYSRCGLIETHRGNIKTPAFMPVGTQATVKATFVDDIIKTGSEIILSNTYHLMLRPGVERIKSAGGLHKFMNCTLPILTDSGGFQVMSLSKFVKIDKKMGPIFNSHIDGKKLSKIYSPNHALVNKSSSEVVLKIVDPKSNKRQSIHVQTIASEQELRYRDWVEKNREYVHKKSNNKRKNTSVKQT